MNRACIIGGFLPGVITASTIALVSLNARDRVIIDMFFPDDVRVDVAMISTGTGGKRPITSAAVLLR